MIGTSVTSNSLRAFVRLDAYGRVVPSSLLLLSQAPSDADSGTYWLEINATYRPPFIPTTTTTTTIHGGVTPTAFILPFWYSVNQACSGESPQSPGLFYSASTYLFAGSTLFTNAALTIPVQSGFVILNGLTKLLVGTGGVLSVLQCATTTTTTTTTNLVLKWRYSTIPSPQDVCINPGLLPFSFNGSTLCNSTIIYLDTTSIGDSIVFYGAYQGIARVWVVVGPNQANLFNPVPDCFVVPC
jgi:hypothetical protein